MKLIRLMLILAVGMILSACTLSDYFTIVNVESSQAPVSEGEAPPDLYFSSGDSISAMDRGSYCWTSETSGICADMIPPSYEANQHNLMPSHKLEFLFFPPVPDTVTVSLHHGSSVMDESGEDILIEDIQLEPDGRLIVTIPDNIEGRYILMVFATWKTYGDVSYTMPIFLQQ